MLVLEKAKNNFYDFYSKVSVNAITNWMKSNKDYIAPIAFPFATLAISKVFFKFSLESSLGLSAMTFVATIVDQKNPNIKNQIFEKIKTLSKIIYERYQEVEKARNDRLDEKEKKETIENTLLIKSYLEFGYDQIMQECKVENSAFIASCKELRLSDTKIKALLNYYKISPKSSKENNDDYLERLEKFIELLDDDKKYLFQTPIKKEIKED